MATRYSVEVSSLNTIPVPFIAGSRQASLVKFRNFLNRLIGGNRDSNTTISVRTASVAAGGYVKLVSCAAGTVVEINGVPFTALSGTATVANDEFDIAGTDAADAGKLRDAINASTTSGISGVVSALANADKLTPATAIAGDKFKVVLADGTSHVFVGVAGAATAGALNFSIDTSNAATATSITAQVNGYAPFSGKVQAVDGTTKVTFNSLDGRAFTLTGTATTLAEANDGRVQITALAGGKSGNGITLKTLGLVATTTATCASVVATDTLVLNGATLTGIVQRATGTITPNVAVAGNTVTINGNVLTAVAGARVAGSPTFSIDTDDAATCASLAACINDYVGLGGLVTATATSTVVTIRAVSAGTAGNSISLASTATRLAKSGTALSGGIAVANNQFDTSAGSTDTQVAADIVRCINASTTTAISGFVRAFNRAAVVHLWSKVPGLPGNGITAVSTGGTITVAAARLAGATTASYEGAQAQGTLTLTSWLNGETVAVNGVTITAHTNTQANNQVDISGVTDTADAANLCLAINNSTTAALADVIATSSSNVVTIKSRRGGTDGNLITLSSGQASVVANVSRLAGGAVPTTVVCSAPRLTNGAHTSISLAF